MIKTIIFDFGDVFINLDKEATLRAILRKFPAFKMTKEIECINQDYETGKLSTEGFIAFYTNYLKTNNTTYLIDSWNAIILDFPEHRLDFIKELSINNQFNLILLSNTNQLHIKQVIENMTSHRYEKFKSYFDKFYLSHNIGLRKPNKDIFEFVLNENKLEAKNCYYIDDTKEHIDSANQLGFQTWNLNPAEEDVVEMFKINSEKFL